MEQSDLLFAKIEQSDLDIKGFAFASQSGIFELQKVDHILIRRRTHSPGTVVGI
jgi:hypothetical protein